jgi:transposase
MGCNVAGARQQEDVQAHARRRERARTARSSSAVEDKSRATHCSGGQVKVVAIQEVGLDGFWIHRLLEANGVESHVVDPASIAVPRRHRRAKTDAIDGDTLLRTLMAWQRGEPRVCAMLPARLKAEILREIDRLELVLRQISDILAPCHPNTFVERIRLPAVGF